MIQEAERALSAALTEAWLTDPEPGADHLSASSIVAPLTAAIWLAAARVVFVEQRRCAPVDEDLTERVARVERLVDRVLAGIQSQIDTAPIDTVTTPTQQTRARSDTGWPPAGIRRAG
ncbi:hypothetical protein [Blastococcus brunescens]|uniref:Uncharacterized protein n=1 Tax=Blastococcus brunescens TaxID=1564165 RepID=A0ABZ1B5F4_9ACTN|nr:hypothetical protein [Blastococcus sp. BMG 8361]WRL64255.1 hypothetical protein U6N30_32725 [Blastococcus sp. BMG 8361]